MPFVMDQSSLLMSAQIHFIDIRLSLIHIPLKQYQTYLSTILKLLFPSPSIVAGQGHTENQEDLVSWANAHPFLNVSVTPIEISIVCSTVLAEKLFAAKIAEEKKNSPPKSIHASISSVDYVVISVEGGGSEAGQRVLELTGPLALAGISLFFITTYFSDYILVPTRAKVTVIRALEDRGFAFEKSSKAYVNPSAHSHNRNASSTSSLTSLNSPSTPPPTTISELQARTFALLNKRSITPRVDRDLQLIQCAGRHGNPQSSNADAIGLQLGLTKCLIHQPKFLSLTLTEDESASILIEKRLLANFDVGSDNVLVGSKEEHLIPITLDLEPLPFEATGIVCGIAGRLVGGHSVVQAIEMSYLSTAKAGTVMVEEGDLEHAMMALRVREDGAIEP